MFEFLNELLMQNAIMVYIKKGVIFSFPITNLLEYMYDPPASSSWIDCILIIVQMNMLFWFAVLLCSAETTEQLINQQQIVSSICKV